MRLKGVIGIVSLMPTVAHAADASPEHLTLAGSPMGIAALIVFLAAYVFVVLEERLHLHKSKPVMLGAAAIWAMIAWYAADNPAVLPMSQVRSGRSARGPATPATADQCQQQSQRTTARQIPP